MRRQLAAVLGLALLAACPMPFKDSGDYACNPDNGDDCVTCDAGSGWCRDITAKVLGADFLLTISAADPNNIWAGGAGGLIVKWNGKRWSQQSSGTYGPINALWAAKADEVFYAGNDAGWGVYDGSGWRSFTQFSGLTNSYGLGGRANRIVWMVGENGEVTYLQNGDGSGWTSGDPIDNYVVWYLYGTAQHDPGTGLIPTTMWAAWTDTANYSYLVGNYGTVLKDPPAGTSLADAVPLTTNTTENLYAIAGVPATTDHFWVVGANGTILYYDGSAFVSRPATSIGVGAGVFLWGVCATGEDDVWVGGTNQTLIHWNGTAWSAVAQPFAEDIYNIYCTTQDVFAVTSEASILRLKR